MSAFFLAVAPKALLLWLLGIGLGIGFRFVVNLFKGLTSYEKD